MNRELPNESQGSTLGPGQYNVALPMVKPRFEAIRKNNHTIIVKINEKLSPAFQSHEPRFPSSRKEAPSEEKDFAMVGDQEVETIKNQKQYQSLAIKNRIQKLNQILKDEHWDIQGKKAHSMQMHNTIDSDEILNNLKLYKKEKERLHFLLRNVKPGKHGKGVEWSKYR